jgi:lysophospholipase L1-like esterase
MVMARARVLRWLAGPALALASTLVCLLAIEGWARVSDARRVRHQRARLLESPGVRFHPLLGWEKVPGHAHRAQRGEGIDYVFRYNSHGLRGPEREYARPSGTRRVLVLGDSFAEGFFTSQEGTVSGVLERRLAAEGCAPCEAINGGTAAYSTDQEYLFYREKGRRYGARAVVLMFYYNDLFYDIVPVGVNGGAKPLFALAGDTLRLTNTPLPTPSPSSRQERQARIQPQEPWHGSVALRWLGTRLDETNPRLDRLLARAGIVPASMPTPAEELTVFGVGERVPAMWRVTHALLRDLKRAVEADGARLIVLYVPVVFEIDDHEWELTRERYRLGRRWAPDKVVNKLADICRELEIPLADPRGALRRANANGHSPYYRSDFHWNATGHRIAAEVATPLVRAALDCGGHGR